MNSFIYGPSCQWLSGSMQVLAAPCSTESSEAEYKSRWSSWAFRLNEPYGFCGRKATLNHA